FIVWYYNLISFTFFFFFQAEDGIRDLYVTGVQTCALPILPAFPGAALAICLLALGLAADCQRGARKGRQYQKDAKRRAGVQGHQRGRESRRRRQPQAQASRAAQARANTSVPFVPPKPNELERATRIGILRAALAT